MEYSVVLNLTQLANYQCQVDCTVPHAAVEKDFSSSRTLVRLTER